MIRKCSNCYGILDPKGHNRATCPDLFPDRYEVFRLDDDEPATPTLPLTFISERSEEIKDKGEG